MGWFSKKPSWEITYAQRLYDSLIAPDDFGEITPERLRIPLASYRRYADKAVSQREIICFVALMTAADKNTAPKLLPVLQAFAGLLEAKFSARGVTIDIDQFADQSAVEVSNMVADPFPWAQRWLAEFRDDPHDNYMVALFADHCLKQYSAFKHAITSTYRG